MRSVYSKLVIALLLPFLISSCLSSSPMFIEVKPCQGEEVNNWLQDTFRRIDKAYNSSDVTTAELERLYLEQQNQTTHVCMTDAQEYASNIFYHQWQAALANQQGNSTETLNHLTQAKKAYDQMVEELNRLSKEYEWESN